MHVYMYIYTSYYIIYICEKSSDHSSEMFWVQFSLVLLRRPRCPLGKTEPKDWHKLLGGNTWQDVARRCKTFQHVITKWCPSDVQVALPKLNGKRFAFNPFTPFDILWPRTYFCEVAQFMDHHAICLQSHERLYRPCRKDAFFPQLGTQVLWPHWPRWGRLEVWICWVKSQAQMMPGISGMARFGQQLLFQSGIWRFMENIQSWQLHVNFTYFFTPFQRAVVFVHVLSE